MSLLFLSIERREHEHFSRKHEIKVNPEEQLKNVFKGAFKIIFCNKGDSGNNSREHNNTHPPGSLKD